MILSIKKSVAYTALLLLTSCSSTSEYVRDSSSGDNQPGAKNNTLLNRYQNAEKLLPNNLLSQVNNLYLDSGWIEESGLWYALDENNQKNYWQFQPGQGIRPLFDKEQLARALSSDTSELDGLEIQEVAQKRLSISLAGQDWRCQLTENITCEKTTTEHHEDLVSPDKSWQIKVQDHNLQLLHRESGKVIQLTRDGTADFPYATESINPKQLFNQPDGSIEPAKVGYWSPDSHFFISFQLDLRKVGKLHLSQSVTGESQRPRLYQYHYPMAGDEHLIEGHMVIVDTENGNVEKIATTPLKQTYYGDPLWGEFANDNNYYFVERERGFHRYHLKQYSPQTGELRTLLTETNDKFIDPWVQDFRILPEQDRFFWTSERSGMQQLYMYQLSSGKLLNTVTPRDTFMRVIRGIDTDNQQLYFEGSGREPGDAYYRYLYRVNWDGSELTLLTPEIAMHNTELAPDFSYFTDSYSTVQQAIRHVLRSGKDGNILQLIHRVDEQALLENGYQKPEPFTVIAEDGETPLHGILYLPSDFDPNKRYPILDDIYTGPHGFFTPKTFDGPLYAHANALAELGFVVFKMDGRGTGKRERKFHEYSYDNLAGGADDHVWALKQLAKTRPWLDLDRVGIYGFSAGGYDTVRAMYKYPEFYKAGVAASGNHDFRADKAGWNETWMGYPMGEHWQQQSNLSDAEKLQGKLLLAHGELDENVHPAATLQLADKLIKANKHFEFMIYPNMGHVLHYHPYFVRSRWDFFIKHLLKVAPVSEYQITSMEVPAMAR